MNSSTNGNAAAFPVHPDTDRSGLTKREYFAAIAMQGILANDFNNYIKMHEDCDTLAHIAANYANALINELNK